MKYEITFSSYAETQTSRGSLKLKLENFDEEVLIDVTEISTGLNHDVIMDLNFIGKSTEYKKSLLKIIPTKKRDEDYYTITDENLVSELFTYYGNNS